MEAQRFTRCSLLAEIHSLLVTRCKIRSLLVAEVARCKNSLVTPLLITRSKNLLVVKNRLLFVAKFNRYLLQKFTKNNQLNLVMSDKS